MPTNQAAAAASPTTRAMSGRTGMAWRDGAGFSAAATDASIALRRHSVYAEVEGDQLC